MYKRAAADYKFFLERFPKSKQAYLIHFYYAEILYHELKNFGVALTQYQRVIELDKKGKFVEDAALGVIYCSYDLMVKNGIRQAGQLGKVTELNRKELEAQRKKDRKIQKIQRTELHRLETAYVNAADQYVTLLLRLRKDPEFIKKYPKRGAMIPEIMYLAADTYYRHSQFSESVARLKKIFEYNANHKYAAVAAVTMVKAYSRVRHWTRVEEWARRLIKKKNFKYKSRGELEEYIVIAIHENSMDLSEAGKHDEAIKESMRLVKEFRQKKAIASQALFNVAVLYEQAGDINQAIKTYRSVARGFKGPWSSAAEAAIRRLRGR